MGKNYVEEFMKENNLKYLQKFQVKGCSRDIFYYFSSADRKLYKIEPKDWADSLDNEMFVSLLSGNERIIKNMEKAAITLGVELMEKFKVFSCDGKYLATFYLNDEGLKQVLINESYDTKYNTDRIFIGLFTGEYYIKEQ